MEATNHEKRAVDKPTREWMKDWEHKSGYLTRMLSSYICQIIS